MNNITIIILLLTVITALSELTDRIKIPFPILVVLVGMAIGLVPGLPEVSLDPDIVFLIFLPPVLYGAAWGTSWPDFKANIRPISGLAIGCVLFTTTMVAVIAHACIPGFGWAESFVLGAIISPPDAVAATAATKGLAIPKRLITILEGESLVNDATGLIAYRYAVVAAAGTGSFVMWLAGINFLYVAVLGILIGLAMGYVFFWIHKITPDNPTNDTVLTFIAPYASYLTAEHFHASGVLAVVVMGVFLSQRSSIVFNHQARLQAYNVWETIMFILNGLIFILIGLQMPAIVRGIEKFSVAEALGYGAIISVATIVLRILWVFPSTYAPRLFSQSIRKREGVDSKMATVIAWSGMRGVVSLAAALALPLTVNDKPFPNRDVILFITFAVIFSTLVLQGLTIPKVIKWIGLQPDEKEEEREFKARMKMAAHIIEHIEENYALGLSEDVLAQIKTKYEIRIERMRQEVNRKMTTAQIEEFHRIQRELIQAERRFALDLRRSHAIDDEVHRKLEYELDLDEERLLLEVEQLKG